MKTSRGFGWFLVFLLSAFTASAINYTLTVNVQGSGTAARNPSSASYPLGATVTVTATPSAGSNLSSR